MSFRHFRGRGRHALWHEPVAEEVQVCCNGFSYFPANSSTDTIGSLVRHRSGVGTAAYKNFMRRPDHDFFGQTGTAPWRIACFLFASWHMGGRGTPQILIAPMAIRVRVEPWQTLQQVQASLAAPLQGAWGLSPTKLVVPCRYTTQ